MYAYIYALNNLIVSTIKMLVLNNHLICKRLFALYVINYLRQKINKIKNNIINLSNLQQHFEYL